MCGIVAIIRNRSERNTMSTLVTLQNVFRDLMVLSQKRGNAASGIFSSNTDHVGLHKIQTLRSPLRAEDMLNSTAGTRIVKSFSNYTNFMVGHTRAATPGAGSARNNYNNHPHVCGKIIGVHNGVIDKTKPTRALQGLYDMKGACDSEMLFALIDQKKSRFTGTRAAIKEALLQVKGWYSLILMNTENPEKIFVVRDSSSPLESIWWKEGNCFIIASEEWMLDEIVEKHNLKGVSTQTVMDNVLFGLDTRKTSKEGMIERTAVYINPEDNKPYIDKHKKEYEKTQGR